MKKGSNEVFVPNSIRISIKEYDLETGKQFQEDKIITYDELDKSNFKDKFLLYIVHNMRENISKKRKVN